MGLGLANPLRLTLTLPNPTPCPDTSPNPNPGWVRVEHLAAEQRARADVLLPQHVRTVQAGARTCERQIGLQSARLGFEPVNNTRLPTGLVRTCDGLAAVSPWLLV